MDSCFCLLYFLLFFYIWKSDSEVPPTDLKSHSSTAAIMEEETQEKIKES